MTDPSDKIAPAVESAMLRARADRASRRVVALPSPWTLLKGVWSGSTWGYLAQSVLMRFQRKRASDLAIELHRMIAGGVFTWPGALRLVDRGYPRLVFAEALLSLLDQMRESDDEVGAAYAAVLDDDSTDCGEDDIDGDLDTLIDYGEIAANSARASLQFLGRSAGRLNDLSPADFDEVEREVLSSLVRMADVLDLGGGGFSSANLMHRIRRDSAWWDRAQTRARQSAIGMDLYGDYLEKADDLLLLGPTDQERGDLYNFFIPSHGGLRFPGAPEAVYKKKPVPLHVNDFDGADFKKRWPSRAQEKTRTALKRYLEDQGLQGCISFPITGVVDARPSDARVHTPRTEVIAVVNLNADSTLPAPAFRELAEDVPLMYSFSRLLSPFLLVLGELEVIRRSTGRSLNSPPSAPPAQQVRPE